MLRELGIRLVIYIDDILIMAESKDKARDDTLGLIYLLKNLGFIIHPMKAVTAPTQEIEFWGMQVDLLTLELRVSGRKLKHLRQKAAKMESQSTPPSAQEVPRLLGKMNSVSQAIAPAPLFCRAIQMDLAAALNEGSQSYESPYPLSLRAREQLSWWSRQLTRWNGKGLVLTEPDIRIESDASLVGCRASCRGILTGGPWSEEEKKYHINCLELLAATLAVKSFVKDQQNKVVLLLIDNQTAVAYINNLGGTISAQAKVLARTLWMWSLERGITLQAQYLPGEENVRADQESRVMRDHSDWMLNPAIFQRVLR